MWIRTHFFGFLLFCLCGCLPTLSIAQEMPAVEQDNVIAERQIKQFLERWRGAWEARDTDLYLAHYAPNYAGKADNPSAWQANRRQALGAASDLEIRIDAPEIHFPSPARAEVHFQQRYRSASHTDLGKKMLVLVRWDGRWLITAETFTPLR